MCFEGVRDLAVELLERTLLVEQGDDDRDHARRVSASQVGDFTLLGYCVRRRARARRSASSYSSGIGQLARAVRDEEPRAPDCLERVHRLLEREVAARLAVEVAAEQRRLADEEVGVPRGLDELGARRRVARVREQRVEFSTRNAYVWSV